MNNTHHSRKVCESWYHHSWFRILLIIIGIDMLVFGFLFAVDINVLIFFAAIVNPFARVVMGIAYVIVAGYIINHALSYYRLKEEMSFVCHHCVEDEDANNNHKPHKHHSHTSEE